MCQLESVAATMVSSVFVKILVRSCGLRQLHATASAADGAQRKHVRAHHINFLPSTVSAPCPPLVSSHSQVEAQYSPVYTTAAFVAATGPLALVCMRNVPVHDRCR
jgi:hypothetical protein